MKEMLASDQIVKRIDHGDVKILVEQGGITTSLLVVSRENIRFRQSLRSLSLEFESEYREELAREVSNLAVFEPHRLRAKDVLG